MIQSNVLLHIGYHKTGTTFLQKKVFPALPANLLMMPNVSYIATSKAYEAAHFIQLLKSQMTSENHALTILSQETLSGRGDGNPIWDPQLIAKRLRQTFPNTKILIVIRNQFDYILSLYAFRVVRRGLEHRSLDRYLQQTHTQLCQKLQYDRLVGDYVRLFGRDKVLVLPFEQLAANSSKFLDPLLSFIGCTNDIGFASERVNPSTRNGRLLTTNRLLNTPISLTTRTLQKHNLLSQKSYIFLVNKYFFLKKRLINPLFERFLQPTLVPFTIPAHWQKQMFPIFQASNHRLANLINFDLQYFGYPW